MITVMDPQTPLWTLDELGQQVEQALAVDYAGQPSGRVRDVPDRRTIRFYTTLGLIDRPAAMRGRTALYGRRHLLQLVAVKRLQAHGLSLAEVQARLVGLTDAALDELARLPDDSQDMRPKSPAPPPNDNERRDSPFWGEPPADVPLARTLTGVPLADGATLLLDASRPLDEQDLSALRAAAAPLLSALRARRLVGADGSQPPTKGESP
jgi:DNA-binding transcriptional MerR regulator